MSTSTQTLTAAARAVEATKVYGSGDTAVVALDEVTVDLPTGNLDSRSGTEVLGFLRRAVDQLGQSVVMVTHDPAAAAHADAVVFLADGRVIDRMADPTAERILDTIKRLGS